jgi:putative glutamine amidotransferase
VVASGHADDGIVEAIELPDRSFAVGVLWHPEEDERSRVVGALVDEARDRMRAPTQ